MAKDRSNGRGEFTDPIELHYAQIPHEVWHMLFIELRDIDEITRMRALWYYINNYFTNSGYSSLEVKSPSAHAFCKMLDRISYISQNNARWACFDDIYRGDINKTYDEALADWKEAKRAKKKELNKKYYLKRKQQEAPNLEQERKDGFDKLNKFAEENNIHERFEY